MISCQRDYGKKILLSLGGGYPTDYRLNSDASGRNFADFLWKAWGPIQANYTGPRPWGNAVVDGFDFDIESVMSPAPSDNPDYQTRGYAAMINYMKVRSGILVSLLEIYLTVYRIPYSQRIPPSTTTSVAHLNVFCQTRISHKLSTKPGSTSFSSNSTTLPNAVPVRASISKPTAPIPTTSRSPSGLSRPLSTRMSRCTSDFPPLRAQRRAQTI